MISLPELVADGLFARILLIAKWLKAVGACLDVSWLEQVVDSEKLKKLLDPSNDFVVSVFSLMPVNWKRFLLMLLFCVV